YLATQPDVVAAYLFGSLAMGRATTRSDVDIAVLLRDGYDIFALDDRRFQLMGALEPFANCEMDVIILNHVPTLLQHEVVRCRRLLYVGDRAARVDFEVRAGKMYADEQPMRDFFTHVMFKEIDEGRFGQPRSRGVRAPKVSANHSSACVLIKQRQLPPIRRHGHRLRACALL
ncbi:MAG: nucleotidyltransferase domain-containing protein, partial [Chloroflexota bacterium]